MIDLRDKLTVFLITCGNNPNLDDCRTALGLQTSLFKMEEVKDFTPMSRAFQEMMNRCTTPYYIQVDEDMILNPDAIEKMYKGFYLTQQTECMHCYFLHDVHLNMSIMGVKIYLTDIFRKYPYDFNHPSCEVEQLERMKRDGYTWEGKDDVVGLHAPKWTEEGIFERYYNLMHKYRIYGYKWMASLPMKLRVNYELHPNDINFYALAGCLAGVFDKHIINEEKDATKKLRTFVALEDYLTGKINAK